MTPEEEKELKGHVQAIAKILYRQTQPEQLETLAKIEETVRKQTLQYISPRVGFFLSNKLQEQRQGEPDI
jgi:hypothetical protein